MIIFPDRESAGFIYADGGARKEAELFQCSAIKVSEEINE